MKEQRSCYFRWLVKFTRATARCPKQAVPCTSRRGSQQFMGKWEGIRTMAAPQSCPQPDLSTQHAHLSAQFSLSHVSEPTQNADHGQGLGNPLKHPIAFAPNWYSDPEVEPDAKNHACSGSVQEIQLTWNTVLSDLTTYIWAPKLDWSTSSSFLGCPIQVPKLFNWLYLSLWSHSKGLD